MSEQDPVTPASGPAPGAPQAPELPPPTGEALEIEELQRQRDQAKDLLLRKVAEFENYKRRTENEISSIIKRAAEDLITDILPVLDDLERSLKAGRTADQESFYRGVELIHQKLTRTLEGVGVRTFETVGKEFNVDYHDALMQVPRSDIPPHTVVEEVEKGYQLHDRVIRHAKVVVSTLPPDAPTEQQPISEQQ